MSSLSNQQIKCCAVGAVVDTVECVAMIVSRISTARLRAYPGPRAVLSGGLDDIHNWVGIRYDVIVSQMAPSVRSLLSLLGAVEYESYSSFNTRQLSSVDASL